MAKPSEVIEILGLIDVEAAVAEAGQENWARYAADLADETEIVLGTIDRSRLQLAFEGENQRCVN